MKPGREEQIKQEEEQLEEARRILEVDTYSKRQVGQSSGGEAGPGGDDIPGGGPAPSLRSRIRKE